MYIVEDIVVQFSSKENNDWKANAVIKDVHKQVLPHSITVEIFSRLSYFMQEYSHFALTTKLFMSQPWL